jgi:hypothetical protein
MVDMLAGYGLEKAHGNVDAEHNAIAHIGVAGFGMRLAAVRSRRSPHRH